MSCLISLSTEWWFSRGLSSAVLSLSVFSVAYAQTEPDVEGVQKPLWEAGLAGFGLTGPAYPGAEDDVGRALALCLAYSAFLAEIFRAGLQAVDQGQIEAGKALGLSGWQRFRHIVFPQAFRMILPPLGNDFVAMVKDSSLVSVLGVGDVAQLAKVTAAGNFLYFETYNVAALIYLTMTIGLSLMMRRLELRLKAKDGR